MVDWLLAFTNAIPLLRWLTGKLLQRRLYVEVLRLPEPKFYAYQVDQPSALPPLGSFPPTVPPIGLPKRIAIVAEFHVRTVNRHAVNGERILACKVVRKGRKRFLRTRRKAFNPFTAMYFPAASTDPVENIELPPVTQVEFRVRATEFTFGSPDTGTLTLTRDITLDLELNMAGSARRIIPLCEMHFPFM